MATIELEIAARKYLVACRDGEEAPLRSAAALVDQRARDAAAALGSLSESRLLLLAALMLADDVHEMQSNGGGGAAPAPASGTDEQLLSALEAMASRIEALAERVDGRAEAHPRA
jgi:cell division protein ZapA